MSRKADFIPPLTSAVEAGWSAASIKASRSEGHLEQLAKDSEIALEYPAERPNRWQATPGLYPPTAPQQKAQAALTHASARPQPAVCRLAAAS